MHNVQTRYSHNRFVLIMRQRVLSSKTRPESTVHAACFRLPSTLNKNQYRVNSETAANISQSLPNLHIYNGHYCCYSEGKDLSKKINLKQPHTMTYKWNFHNKSNGQMYHEIQKSSIKYNTQN